MDKVIVLDASAFMFNAIHLNGSMNLLKQEGKLSDNAFIAPITYTYVSMIISCLKRIGVDKDDTIIIAQDARNSWRRSFYPIYKGQRKDLRDKQTHINWDKCWLDIKKINNQLNESTDWHFLKFDNVYTLLDLLTTEEGERLIDDDYEDWQFEKDYGLESDDIQAIVPKVFPNKEIIIVTGDKDLYQIAHYPNVKIWSLNLKKIKGGKGGYCLTQDAEILTNRGWKKYYQMKKNHTIATYNIDKDCIEFGRTSWIHKSYFIGEVDVIENRSLKIKSAPNHNHVIKSRLGGVKLKQIKDLKKHDSVLLGCKKFNYTNKYFVGLYWAELIGWFISDGHFINKNQKAIGISQSYKVNKEKCERIKFCLDKAKINYRVNKIKKGMMVFFISKCPFNDWLYVNLCNKKIPNYKLLNLPLLDLKALFRGLIDGDGSVRSKTSFRFYQKEKQIIEFVEILAFKLGYTTHTTYRKNRDIYTISITKRNSIELYSSKIYKEKYSGIIWCPTTKNKTWIAKQNGQVFITGNSVIKSPLKIIADKVRLGDASDNIIVDKLHDTDLEQDRREFIINLLKMPQWVELPIRNVLENLQKKEMNYDKLPFKNSLARRFDQIYEKKNVVTFEYCQKLLEKREIKRKEKQRLKYYERKGLSVPDKVIKK